MRTLTKAERTESTAAPERFGDTTWRRWRSRALWTWVVARRLLHVARRREIATSGECEVAYLVLSHMCE